MEILAANQIAAKPKRVIRNGREYYLVCATSIVPGVLPGSQGPLFYPHNEIKRNYRDWNRIPVTLNHPFRNGIYVSATDPIVIDKQGIGEIYETEVNGKLKHNLLIDIEKANRLDKRIVQNIERGIPIELSTGLYTDNIPAPMGAHYNGKTYSHIARNYRPDHIAILPDQVGACSLQDGCGVLVNKKMITDNTRVSNMGEDKLSILSKVVNWLTGNEEQPRHENGQYLHKGGRAGSKQVQSAAEEGYTYYGAECVDPVEEQTELVEEDESLENPAGDGRGLATPRKEPYEDEEEEEGHIKPGTMLEEESEEHQEPIRLTGNTWTDEAREASKASRAASANRGATARHMAYSKFANAASEVAGKEPTIANHGNAASAHLEAASKYSKSAADHESKGRSEQAGLHKAAAEAHMRAAGAHFQQQEAMRGSARKLTTHGVYNVSSKLSHSEIHESLQGQLRDKHSQNEPQAMVQHVYDDHLIYEKGGKSYKSGYETKSHRDGKDTVHLSKDEPQEVEKNMSYNRRTDNLVIAYNRKWTQKMRDKLSDEDFAGPHQSFPIKTQEDLEAAVHSMGRAGGSISAIKAGIKRIAKRKGLKLPEAWQKETTTNMRLTANTWSDEAREAAAAARKASAVASKGDIVGKLRSQTAEESTHQANEASRTAHTAHDHQVAAALHGQAMRGHSYGEREHGQEASTGKDRLAMKISKSDRAASKEASSYHGKAAEAHKNLRDYHDRQAAAMTGNSTHNQRKRIRTMNREQMLEQLTANCSCENDKVALNSLSDETLQLVLLNAKAEGSNADVTGKTGAMQAGGKGTKDEYQQNRTDEEEGDDDEDEEDEEEVEHDKGGRKRTRNGGTTANQLTMNQWLAMAPPEAREAHQASMEIVNAERQKLITRLVANTRSEKEKQDALKWLNLKKLPELRQMVSILPLPVVNQNRYGGLPSQQQNAANYIGQGGGPPPVTNKDSGDDDVLDILTMNQFIKEEEAKKVQVKKA